MKDSQESKYIYVNEKKHKTHGQKFKEKYQKIIEDWCRYPIEYIKLKRETESILISKNREYIFDWILNKRNSKPSSLNFML